MITVRAIFDGKQVKFLENIPVSHPTNIMVTFLEDEPLLETNKNYEIEASAPLDLFDDMIGIITEKDDGAINHDIYIYSKENL